MDQQAHSVPSICEWHPMGRFAVQPEAVIQIYIYWG
jgi:hypothetical protein